MYYEIYLDFYFLENLFTDCAMLVLTAEMLRQNWKWKNIFLAGFLESVVSCMLLFFSVKNMVLIRICQTGMAFFMIRMGLGKKKCRDLFLEVSVFYLISFCFGGAVLAVAGAKKTAGVSGKSSAVSDPADCASLLWKEKNRREHIYEAEVFRKGKSDKVKALYDTGNRLREPYQKRPVNIIEYDAVKELLTGDEKIFLIPYRTVNGGGKMFTGLTFDRMRISKGRKTEIYEHPVIALAKEKLSSDDSYQMILHPENRKDQEEKSHV